MLKNTELFEFGLHEIDGIVSVTLGVNPSRKHSDINFMSLNEDLVEILTNAVFTKLIYQVFHAQILEHKFGQFLVDFCGGCHLSGLKERLEIVVLKLFDFDFNLEARTMLVLDVLGGTQAREFPVDHDADLGAESLGFVHGMSRQNHGGFHVLNRYFRDDLLHVSACLRVNTS